MIFKLTIIPKKDSNIFLLNILSLKLIIAIINSPFATNFTTNQNLPIIVHDFG